MPASRHRSAFADGPRHHAFPRRSQPNERSRSATSFRTAREDTTKQGPSVQNPRRIGRLISRALGLFDPEHGPTSPRKATASPRSFTVNTGSHRRTAPPASKPLKSCLRASVQPSRRLSSERDDGSSRSLSNQTPSPRRRRKSSSSSSPRHNDRRTSSSSSVHLVGRRFGTLANQPENDQHEKESPQSGEEDAISNHEDNRSSVPGDDHRRIPSHHDLDTLPEDEDDDQPKFPHETNAVSENDHQQPPLPPAMSELSQATSPPEAPFETVTCVICMDDVQADCDIKLGCEHHMCSSCIKRLFKLSLTDPALMPPKCCGEEPVPLDSVSHLFGSKFRARWSEKYREYTCKNPLYCSRKKCGKWIPPERIKRCRASGTSFTRRAGRCLHCGRWVCADCKRSWHQSEHCPRDPATKQFEKLAKKQGWQTCFNCSATVELKEGCNHVTCRCASEFCMLCGAKWKTCNCPWFNYADVEADRIRHQGNAGAAPVDPLGHRRFQNFQEEMDARQDQVQRDADIARRWLEMELHMLQQGLWQFAFGQDQAHAPPHGQQAQARHDFHWPLNRPQAQAQNDIPARGQQQPQPAGMMAENEQPVEPEPPLPQPDPRPDGRTRNGQRPRVQAWVTEDDDPVLQGERPRRGPRSRAQVSARRNSASSDGVQASRPEARRSRTIPMQTRHRPRTQPEQDLHATGPGRENNGTGSDPRPVANDNEERTSNTTRRNARPGGSQAGQRSSTRARSRPRGSTQSRSRRSEQASSGEAEQPPLNSRNGRHRTAPQPARQWWHNAGGQNYAAFGRPERGYRMRPVHDPTNMGFLWGADLDRVRRVRLRMVSAYA